MRGVENARGDTARTVSPRSRGRSGLEADEDAGGEAGREALTRVGERSVHQRASVTTAG